MSVGVMGCKPFAKIIEGTSPAVKEKGIQYLAKARLYNSLKLKLWIRKWPQLKDGYSGVSGSEAGDLLVALWYYFQKSTSHAVESNRKQAGAIPHDAVKLLI
jgi:hypothetical protein